MQPRESGNVKGRDYQDLNLGDYRSSALEPFGFPARALYLAGSFMIPWAIKAVKSYLDALSRTSRRCLHKNAAWESVSPKRGGSTPNYSVAFICSFNWATDGGKTSPILPVNRRWQIWSSGVSP